MKHSGLMTLFFTCNIFLFVTRSNGAAIELIYQNRYKINKDIDLVEGNGGINPRNRCFLFFRENIEKPFSFWDKNRSNYYYYETVFEICFKNHSIQNDTSYVLNDVIYVDILFEMLNEHSSSLPHIIKKILLEETSRNAFNKPDYYKDILMHAPIGDKTRLEYFCLLKLSENERDSLLQNDKTPLLIRARLGDRSAEDSIINQYKSQKDYRYKVKYLKELFYIGNERVLHFIASYFNETFYDDRGRCIGESIQYQILLGLRLFHPYEPLLNKPLAELSIKQMFLRIKDDEVRQYLEEVRDWIKNTYNVEFVHEVPAKPILRKPCKH